jgi:hypothetical protein
MSKYTRADHEFSVAWRNGDRWKNLRKELGELAKNTERKQRAIAKAEENDMAWELIKMGCRPVRQKRLFK